jgi:transposase
MAHYRLSHIDLSTRIALSLRMLDPRREWGKVSELARRYGVSRKFLYEMAAQAEQALQSALAPKQAGRRPETSHLVVDSAFLERAMLVLATALPGSMRGIQLALELLFGRHCALGRLSETLQAYGEVARRYNAQLTVPLPVLGEVDEIFQGRQPCLTVVDGRSFLVLQLSAEQRRDATTWGLTFLDLLERGVQFHDIASDGALGIRAGIRDAELAVPLRSDLFHLLRKAHPITRHLEAKAYRAIETTELARSIEQQAQEPKPRRGRPKSCKVSYAQAQQLESKAIERYDTWCWLLSELRQALEPFNAQGELTSSSEARQTLETVALLLKSMDVTKVRSFARLQVLGHLEELIAPLAWLEETLAPHSAHLDADTVAFIVWAWRHRRALSINVEELAELSTDVARAFWTILELFHRASSLAESLHSWLRPHLRAHRGMPNWLLPLLQLFWNHHTFQRGKRKGRSPVQLAGVEQAYSWTEVLDLLVTQKLVPEAVC